MKYQLFPTLDYPKYTSSSLEQDRLHQTTQVVMIPTLHENNLQLTELQLYMNNIARYLVIISSTL